VDSTSIILIQPDVLKLPNGYTPNGDGFNDNFVISGVQGYPNNTFVVYNRWGNVVYSANGYSNQWNGQNNNGTDLPESTYFVILEIPGKETLKGYVDLRRK
jgi:gliding motility-associated-like protein